MCNSTFGYFDTFYAYISNNSPNVFLLDYRILNWVKTSELNASMPILEKDCSLVTLKIVTSFLIDDMLYLQKIKSCISSSYIV